MTKPARAISLFSGIGGFEYGMDDADFQFLANLEFDVNCVATLNNNELTSGGRKILPLDITEVAPADFYAGAVDYIVGGPPCQSFSAAGRRAGGIPGMEDSRGTLFWYYCQYVKHFQPKAFVFENVRGILSSKNGADFEIICKSFHEVGYKLYWRILNAADYGVPQFRERLFLVGVRNDIEIEFKFPRPTHGPDSPNKSPYRTAEEALADLDDADEIIPPYGGKYGHLIPDIPEGENYRFFTEEMGHPSPQFAWRSKFSGFLYKMARNEPCRTVVSQQSRYDGPLHWKGRKCNTSELKRLQGFPDRLKIPHPYVVAVKQIGNSVAPPVATSIGKALRAQLEGLREYEVPLLEQNFRLTFDRQKGVRAKASRSKKSTDFNDLLHPKLFEVGEKTDVNATEIYESVKTGNFSVNRSINGSKVSIDIRECSVRKLSMRISLQFVGAVTQSISLIKVSAYSQRASHEVLPTMWSEIHDVIKRFTSYESLQPLWGHFTEPYPKFEIEFESSVDDLGSTLQRFAVKNAREGRLFRYDEIAEVIGQVNDVVRIGKEMRLDIRTNGTNVTIPTQMLRICYPFSVA